MMLRRQPNPQVASCSSEGGGGAPQVSLQEVGQVALTRPPSHRSGQSGRAGRCAPRRRAGGTGRAGPHLRAAVHVLCGEARPHGLLQQPRRALHRLLDALPHLPPVGIRGLAQLRGQELQPAEGRAVTRGAESRAARATQKRPALRTARGREEACVLESVTLTSSQVAGWPLRD